MLERNISPVHIVSVLGSIRPNSNTAKVLKIVEKEALSLKGISITTIDPMHLELPLPGAGKSEDARAMTETIKAADAVILATPEYHGSYSSVMKLMIDNMGHPSALSGKPVSLIGVASGKIGAIKAVEHLRSVASHVGSMVLPAPVSVANVREMFNAEGELLNSDLQRRISRLVESLVQYARLSICPRRGLEALVREAS